MSRVQPADQSEPNGLKKANKKSSRGKARVRHNPEKTLYAPGRTFLSGGGGLFIAAAGAGAGVAVATALLAGSGAHIEGLHASAERLG